MLTRCEYCSSIVAALGKHTSRVDDTSRLFQETRLQRLPETIEESLHLQSHDEIKLLRLRFPHLLHPQLVASGVCNVRNPIEAASEASLVVG